MASNIPTNYETTGTFFDYFQSRDNILNWEPGKVVFEYPNDQPAGTLWYHDHTLGMTRNNVYAGPAGFWLVRGGDYDKDDLGFVPPPEPDVQVDLITEIPIVIQDRSFYDDGSLFYPKDRAYFEGLEPEQLQIPFIPDEACHWEPSDVHPIWNPEFFGDTIVVNGKTWPRLEVEPRRYRFRFLNGCDSRFLDLKLTQNLRGSNDVFNSADFPFWVLGGDSSFIEQPFMLEDLLLSPAERFDVIIDFSTIGAGETIFLVNDAPDDPFGGFDPMDISTADFQTTGQVMQFYVKDSVSSMDDSFDPTTLQNLPSPPDLGEATVTRHLTLIELDSETVRVVETMDGNIVLDCPNGDAFGPQSALLGTAEKGPLLWEDAITEIVSQVNTIEEWVIENFTADAHPIHVHLVEFQILGRGADGMTPPEPWETAYKDTVIAYPNEITRIKAKFDLPGIFVWHCHILSHEDNEMMRPMFVGDVPDDLPIPVH